MQVLRNEQWNFNLKFKVPAIRIPHFQDGNKMAPCSNFSRAKKIRLIESIWSDRSKSTNRTVRKSVGFFKLNYSIWFNWGLWLEYGWWFRWNQFQQTLAEKPLINPNNVGLRLVWADEFINWTIEEWMKIIFTILTISPHFKIIFLIVNWLKDHNEWYNEKYAVIVYRLCLIMVTFQSSYTWIIVNLYGFQIQLI